jgi:hypothetical protein
MGTRMKTPPNPSAWRRLAVLACLPALASLSACSLVQPVQPWEKGILARTDMRFEGDPLETKFGEHIYSSKEGAFGGAGVGGGGCGCN